MENVDTIRIKVVVCQSASEVQIVQLRLPAGSCVSDAVQQCQQTHFPELLAQLAAEERSVGVWGKKTAKTTILKDGDRLEIYRPLVVDPKESRRLRYRRQGDRGRIRRKAMRPSLLDPQSRTI